MEAVLDSGKVTADLRRAARPHDRTEAQQFCEKLMNRPRTIIEKLWVPTS